MNVVLKALVAVVQLARTLLAGLQLLLHGLERNKHRGSHSTGRSSV